MVLAPPPWNSYLLVERCCWFVRCAKPLAVQQAGDECSSSVDPKKRDTSTTALWTKDAQGVTVGDTTLTLNWIWVGLGVTFVLLAFTFIPDLKSFLRRRSEKRRGNYFDGDGRHRPRENSQRQVPQAVPMVTYAEVKNEYDRRHQLWLQSTHQARSRLHVLNALDYRQMDAGELLEHATDEERGNLKVILGIDAGSRPTAIVDALRKAGSHGLMSAIRGGHVPYEEVVKDVAKKLGAKALGEKMSAADLEKHAVGAAIEQMLAKASPEERQALLTELAKGQTTSSSGLMTATGGLVLANLSGFGLYMAASSSLAAITGAVGLTLPFAVYTGLSSVLGVVTGPVGWATVALVAIFKLGGTEYKKTVPGVIAIASCRARLIASREAEMDKLHKQLADLEHVGQRLSVLALFVARMGEAGQRHSVPRSSVPW